MIQIIEKMELIQIGCVDAVNKLHGFALLKLIQFNLEFDIHFCLFID